MLLTRYTQDGEGCEDAFAVLSRAALPFQGLLADRRRAPNTTDPLAIIAGVRLLCSGKPCAIFFDAFCATFQPDPQSLAGAAHLFAPQE